MSGDEIHICDECGSEFLKAASKMRSLCPECAHVLYEYPKCVHKFVNGKCMLCHWNGARSKYILDLLKDGV